jgi:CRISPR-associated protein Csh1
MWKYINTYLNVSNQYWSYEVTSLIELLTLISIKINIFESNQFIMLSTLTRIGKQLLDGKNIWAQLTSEPKINKGKTNWICPILFDCENGNISILKDKVSRYQPDNSSLKFRYLNTELWGRRGKKCALTVEPKNFSMLEETLFGKGKGEAGTMIRTIDEFPQFVTTPIYSALLEVKEMLDTEKSKLNLAEIKKELDFGKDDEVVLLYSVIKSSKVNNGKPSELINLQGYDEFILEKFGPPVTGEPGLNYLTGNYESNVIEAKFQRGYNPNAIFQTTTLNHAQNFKDFKKNFQISTKDTAAFDKAGNYIINRLQTRIAGITHIVIPSFLHKDLDDFDIEETELFLDRSDELLFKYNSLDADIQRELPDAGLFWVNYMAFESDGNSFKVMNHIKDVNSKYLSKLTETFAATEGEFRNYIGGKYPFNFQTVYYMIPVRDGNKSKNNSALHLFKDILEQRKVEYEMLYKNFTILLKCHRNGQFDDRGYHRAFSNIKEIESFDYAAKDAVFKYIALINTLILLNLLKMDNNKYSDLISIPEKYPHPEVNEFLTLKKCSRNQLALFCLGRALNVVGYAQERKKHTTRPILNKINFNGMEWDDINKLTSEIWEKSNQYQVVTTAKGKQFQVRKKIEEWLDLFSKYAQEENWNFSKEENLFFLMAGYVFRPSNGAPDDDSTINN